MPARPAQRDWPKLQRKKLVYEYVWSLMDRLLFASAGFAMLFSSMLLLSEGQSPVRSNSTLLAVCAATALISAISFMLLLVARRKIFSPGNLFARIRDTVSDTILEPERLGNWKKWNDPDEIENMEDLQRKVTEMLDSIGDFYTRLLSPDIASCQPKDKILSDYGLSFGMKRTAGGLLVFDRDGNLLPEQDDQGRPAVRSVIFDSAAYRAGVRPGDVIVSINDTARSNRSLGQIYSLGRGENRRAATMRLKRGDEDIIAEIPIAGPTVPPIAWRKLGSDIAYLRLETFERLSTAALRNALQRLRNCRAYVIDLRGNRGGDISNGLFLLSAFLSEGVLAYCERRDQSGKLCKMRFRLTSDSIVVETQQSGSGDFLPLHPEQRLKRMPDIANRKPVVVLIDQYSMSGAELFAGAMRDFGRARLIGTKTFGKGVGQDVLSIPPCVKVSVTSMRFTTPSGTWPGDGAVSIRNGIEPDEHLPAPQGVVIGGPDDAQLTRATELITGQQAD